MEVRWGINEAVLIRVLALIAIGSALLSALLTFPSATHRELLAAAERFAGQLFGWP